MTQHASILMYATGLLPKAAHSPLQLCMSGVVGVPNVGKSSLINSLVRARATNTGNAPGITRVAQAVHLDKHLTLLDSPGLVFKPADATTSALHSFTRVRVLMAGIIVLLPLFCFQALKRGGICLWWTVILIPKEAVSWILPDATAQSQLDDARACACADVRTVFTMIPAMHTLPPTPPLGSLSCATVVLVPTQACSQLSTCSPSLHPIPSHTRTPPPGACPTGGASAGPRGGGGGDSEALPSQGPHAPLPRPLLRLLRGAAAAHCRRAGEAAAWRHC